MKHFTKALLVALYLCCFFTACAPKTETPDQTNPTISTDKEDVPNFNGDQDLGELPECAPNTEYIQDYHISTLGISSSNDYTDSKYYWARLRADKNTGKINTDSWAAIDETGRIYGLVPLGKSSDDVEYFNEFLCIEEARLYKYDGSEVTQQYLNSGEILLRITKGEDGFVIWKYQADKEYQGETTYTLRVCSTSGKIIFEINSKNYAHVDVMCYGIQNGSNSFAQLNEHLYLVPAFNSTYMIDLSAGKIFDIQPCKAVQQLQEHASKNGYNYLDSIIGIGNIFFVPTADGNSYAYKVGEVNPLYSMSSYSITSTQIKDRFLSLKSDAWALYDTYTGKQVYTSQNSISSLTFDEIEYSTKHNVYIEQVGDFVGVFSKDGTPCFEPIEGKLVANWLDYNGNLLIKYTSHAHNGAGLYVVDLNGNMTKLSITGSAFALNAQNRIIVVDDGTYKLYDKNWNQLY